jgi:C4-dicarboxylate transporter/malic acid transport protein
MSTGAVAVVLAQTPNRFPGLQTIGTIVFILDLVLFSLFTCLMITRFILVPQKLVYSLHHPIESLFFGAYWVSVALILNCTSVYGGPSTGPWLTKALEVLFWMYCAIAFMVSIGQYYMLFQEERLNIMDAMPNWVFPVYPLLVVGSLAGTIAPIQPPQAAWNIWVGGVALQGTGWAVAIMIYAMFTQRLMSSQLPSPPSRPGMYVSVGPAGYTAAALFTLGSIAPNVLPPNQFTSSGLDGLFIKNLGTISGLFLCLFSFWFFCIRTVAVLVGLREMSFTLNWWALVFPNAGMTLAIIQAGKALGSEGINGVCSAATIVLVILWFVCAIANIRALWLGQLLWPGKDEDSSMEGIEWGYQKRR